MSYEVPMQSKCLIVDDSAVTRGMMARALRLSGVGISQILEAANGVEALQILATSRVNLVLSDLHMPVMGGADLIANMRMGHLALIPVVVVSAEPSTQLLDELCGAGASGYLQKPFTPEALRSMSMPLLEEKHEND